MQSSYFVAPWIASWSLSSGGAEPVIGRAFARPVGADPLARNDEEMSLGLQRLQEPHRLARRRRDELALPHNAAAAHEGADRPAGDTHPVIRRPARAGSHPFVVDGLA